MSLRDDLLNLRLDKDQAGGWTRIPCDLRELDLEEITRRSAYVVATDRIVTDLPGRVKYVSETVPFPHVTEGELARCYLDLALEEVQPHLSFRKRRVGFRKVSLPMFEIPAPLHYGGPVSARRLVIVDLDAAYWAIASLATLDVWFRLLEGGGIGFGVGRIGWPRASEVCGPHGLSKPCRHAVIGYMSRQQCEHWHYGERRVGPSSPRYKAPELWGWIVSTLQAVAWEAVENWGCYRVATDSFMIDETDCSGFIDWLSSVWCLSGSVRARGTGRLYGLHRYEIVATRPGDRAKSSRSVEEWRNSGHRGTPEVQWKESSNLISRYARTRAELAGVRGWLAGRCETVGVAA